MVVSDIFGRTPALENLCKTVACDVDVIDPYSGKYMGFQTEQDAYEFFMATVGLNAYCNLLHARLEKAPKPVILVGFSVGASAIWMISESLSTEKVKRAVCFYGSQVRHLVGINPGVVVEHVLPAHEPGFSVDDLACQFSGKENVVLHKTPYLHGFMNQCSKNFSHSGYTGYVDWLRESAS